MKIKRLSENWWSFSFSITVQNLVIFSSFSPAMLSKVPPILAIMEEHNNTQSKTAHLEKLLQFVPACQLRRSIQKTFFAYLLEQDEKGLDAEFKKVDEDYYFLIDFLDKVDSNSE